MWFGRKTDSAAGINEQAASGKGDVMAGFKHHLVTTPNNLQGSSAEGCLSQVGLWEIVLIVN